MFMLVRGGVAPTVEREELEGVWELAEENKDWASKLNFIMLADVYMYSEMECSVWCWYNHTVTHAQYPDLFIT